MIKLISVGFFKELPYGDQFGASLKEVISKFSGSDIGKVSSYLKSGVAFVVAPGTSRDILSGHDEIIGSLALLTDGIFLWPSDLAYYVDNYQIDLPSELMMHMKANDWRVPAVNISMLEM
jgi:hypothetical protein